MDKRYLKRIKKSVKKSKAYKSLSDKEKLMYEFCLYKGADGKEFELNYDEFIIWVKGYYDQRRRT